MILTSNRWTPECTLEPTLIPITVLLLSLGLHGCACGSLPETDGGAVDATIELPDAASPPDGSACDAAINALVQGLPGGICSFILLYDAATDRIDGVTLLGCGPSANLSDNAARTTVAAQTGHHADGVERIYRGDATYSLYYEDAPPPAVALMDPQNSGRVVVAAALPFGTDLGHLELPSAFLPTYWPACPPAYFFRSFDAVDLSTGGRLPDGGRLPLEAFLRTPLAHYFAHLFGHKSAIAAHVESYGEDVWLVIVELGNIGD